MAIERDTIVIRRSREEILSSFRSHEALVSALIPVSAQSSQIDTAVTFEYIFALFQSSLSLFSDAAVINAAVSDAQEFVLPPEFCNSVDQIRTVGSVSQVVAQLQDKFRSREINADRFEECVSLLPPGTLPDYVLNNAQQLAGVGSQYCVQEDYYEHLHHKVDDMRPRVSRLKQCLLKHASKLCEAGKGILLDIRQMYEGPEAFLKKFKIDTKAKAHQTAKYNADGSLRPAGRFLQDLNEDPGGDGYFLHSEENKQRSKDKYGAYQQEQMFEFLQRVYDLCVKNGWKLSELRGIVEDNTGAFNCIRVDPDWVSLVCMRVSKWFLFLPTSNGFGITSTPSIWDTVCLVVDALIRLFIIGILFRWVDDRLVVTHWANVVHDKHILHRENDRMFGPNSLDKEKSQCGSHVACVGYALRFDAGTIAPNDKGLKKLLVVFFLADISTNAKWPLKFCQRIASLADRYSRVVIGMRGFVNAFHALSRVLPTASRQEKEFGVRYPNSFHRFCVVLWRSVILTMYTHPGKLDVPMFSLVNRYADTHLPYFYVASDAYNKLGITVHSSNATGSSLLYVSSFVLPFDAPQADYQNCKEFLGILLALVIIRVKVNAPRGTRLHWTSDSMAALSWVLANRAKSVFAQRAFTAYTWFCIEAGYDVADVVHESASTARMQELDDLSRLNVLHNYDPSLVVDFSANQSVIRLFQLCDPTSLLDTSEASTCQSHIQVFGEITSCIRDICANVDQTPSQ